MNKAADLEEGLRRTNPKGRLWERCAQLGVEPPVVLQAVSGVRHRVEMVLEVEGWELSSGVHWGLSRKHAEQLAARDLLAELEAVKGDGLVTVTSSPPAALSDEDVFDVEESEVEHLRETNPKGQVFEWCQRQLPPVRRPRFAQRTVGSGVAVQAQMDTLGISSPWFRAARRKAAEQAAAAALLPLLPASEQAPTDEVSALPDNPRSALNELVQRKRLEGCHFEPVGRRGPSHAPIFVVVGHATLPGGRKLSTEPLEGTNKREATLCAARALLKLLDGSDLRSPDPSPDN